MARHFHRLVTRRRVHRRLLHPKASGSPVTPRHRKDALPWEGLDSTGTSQEKGSATVEQGNEMQVLLRGIGLEKYSHLFQSHKLTDVATLRALVRHGMLVRYLLKIGVDPDDAASLYAGLDVQNQG